NSFRSASVTLVPARSTPTTGLPGRLSSLVTLPPSFSIIFTAAASSAQPAPARTSSPSSTAVPTATRCRIMTFSPEQPAPDDCHQRKQGASFVGYNPSPTFLINADTNGCTIIEIVSRKLPARGLEFILKEAPCPTL